MSQSSQVEPLHVDFGRFVHTDDVGLQSLASAVWCVLIATRLTPRPPLSCSCALAAAAAVYEHISLSFLFVAITNRLSDDHGEIYIISSRCPHFGCQLLQWSWGIRPNEISGLCVGFENGKKCFAISGIILNSLKFSFHLEVKIFGIRRFHEESFSRFPISFNYQ